MAKRQTTVKTQNYTTPTIHRGSPWVKRSELFAGLDALNQEVEEILNTWRDNGDDAPSTITITDLMEQLEENIEDVPELEAQFALFAPRVAELIALNGDNFLAVAIHWN